MSTDLQEDLAEAIVKNKMLPRSKRKNKGELVASVGYSKVVAKAKPQKIIEQKGVQKALENFGLTKALVTTALVEDIENKPRRRIRELELGADILGLRNEKPNISKTLIVIVASESAQRYGVETASNAS